MKTIMSCGGVTFFTVKALQQNFCDIQGRELIDCPNPYGRAIMEQVREGNVVYVGQSAGTVAMSFSLGPLTTDKNHVTLERRRGRNQEFRLGPGSALGLAWLFPKLGQFLGVPHRIVFRPHMRFIPELGKYEDRAIAAELIGRALANTGSHRDIWAAMCCDYDFAKGQGDVIEISGRGKGLHRVCVVTYHIGHGDRVTDVTPKMQRTLKDFSPTWSYTLKVLPDQPWGVPREGRKFKWTPGIGEVYAAGPKADKPWHMYASSFGLMMDEPRRATNGTLPILTTEPFFTLRALQYGCVWVWVDWSELREGVWAQRVGK